MKIKTSDLTGTALDWAVAKCAEISTTFYGRGLWYGPEPNDYRWEWDPSTNWFEGGPIIEREEIGVRRNAPCSKGREWEAMPSITAKGAGGRWCYGPTPLIAAMRCFVASRLGDEVEVPDDILSATISAGVSP